MLLCAQVSKFGSSISCKQSKFQQKMHSKLWKTWILNFELKLSTDAEDSQKCLEYVFFLKKKSITDIFTCFEAVYLVQKLSLQESLNGTSTTHIFHDFTVSEVMFSKTLRNWGKIFFICISGEFFFFLFVVTLDIGEKLVFFSKTSYLCILPPHPTENVMVRLLT